MSAHAYLGDKDHFQQTDQRSGLPARQRGVLLQPTGKAIDISDGGAALWSPDAPYKMPSGGQKCSLLVKLDDSGEEARGIVATMRDLSKRITTKNPSTTVKSALSDDESALWVSVVGDMTVQLCSGLTAEDIAANNIKGDTGVVEQLSGEQPFLTLDEMMKKSKRMQIVLSVAISTGKNANADKTYVSLYANSMRLFDNEECYGDDAVVKLCDGSAASGHSYAAALQEASGGAKAEGPKKSTLNLAAPKGTWTQKTIGDVTLSSGGLSNERNGITVQLEERVVMAGVKGRVWVDAVNNFGDSIPAAGRNHNVSAKIEMGSAGKRDAAADRLLMLQVAMLKKFGKKPCDYVGEAVCDESKRGLALKKWSDVDMAKYYTLEEDDAAEFKFQTLEGEAIPTSDSPSKHNIVGFRAAGEHDKEEEEGATLGVVKLEITEKSSVYVVKPEHGDLPTDQLRDEHFERKDVYDQQSTGSSFNVEILCGVLAMRAFLRVSKKKPKVEESFPKLRADVLFVKIASGGDGGGGGLGELGGDAKRFKGETNFNVGW